MSKQRYLFLLIALVSLLIVGCAAEITEDTITQKTPEDTTTLIKCPSEGQVLIRLYKPSSPGGFAVVKKVYENGDIYFEDGKGPVLSAIRKTTKLTNDDLNSLNGDIDNFDWTTYEAEQKPKIETLGSAIPKLEIPKLDKEIQVPHDENDLPAFLRTVFSKYENLAQECSLK